MQMQTVTLKGTAVTFPKGYKSVQHYFETLKHNHARQQDPKYICHHLCSRTAARIAELELLLK